MKIIKKPVALQKEMLPLRKKNISIGLVPTMGALHEGHISLIKKSVKENDKTLVSIFVNPTQFEPNEDYLKYPRPLDKDLKICKAQNVDYVFCPSVLDMFDNSYKTFIEVLEMQNILCGAVRKNHFRGVATVVAKLFNISQASKAYFGLKDFQQVKIIQKMSKDLNFPVKIIACPLIRQKDGLALSSRNIYLNAQEKNDALIINKTLKQAAQNFKIKSLDKVLEIAKDSLAKIPNSQIDYLEIRDFDDLSPANKKSKKAAMLIAIKIGKTRLIDNIIMEKK